MPEIILITAPEILAIPINECGEETVDIKHTGDLAYGPPETRNLSHIIQL